MTNDGAIRVEVRSPARFDRAQVLLRIVIAIGLGWLGVTAGSLVAFLYVALPAAAAIALITVGAQRAARELAPGLARGLSWLLRLAAYMAMLADRFPGDDEVVIEIETRRAERATVGGALARLVTSIPSAVVLAMLWVVASVLWIVGAVAVLIDAAVPAPILAFQRGVLRWNARLVAYHASLVDEYPSFAMDTHGSSAAPLAAWRAL